MAHSTAAARLTNMNFLAILGLVFVFASWSLVQAYTELFDPNNQNIEYVAKSHEPDPHMLEEIFPEEYVKAHSGVKSVDEFQEEELQAEELKAEELQGEEVQAKEVQGEEVRDEVSGGGRRDRAVLTWFGVFFLFTLLFWLYTQSAYVHTPLSLLMISMYKSMLQPNKIILWWRVSFGFIWLELEFEVTQKVYMVGRRLLVLDAPKPSQN